MKLTRGQWILALFTALYLIIYAFYYVSTNNYEFLLYIGVVVILALVIFVTVFRKLDIIALWGLSIWGLLHMLGGSLRVGDGVLYAYRIIPIIQGEGQFFVLKMDQVIHFYGFLVSAIVVYQLIQDHIGKNVKLAIFIAWIGAMGLGALNEVVEFVAFVILDKTGVGDVYNTGLDLIFNMFGALAGAFIQYARIRHKS